MKIELHQGGDAQWYMRLVARNGEITLNSEGYSTKSNAQRAARRLRTLLAVPTLIRIKEKQ